MTKLVPLLAIMALFLGLVTVVHAQSAVNICSRTAEVQAAILASVTGSPTCSTITDTQLAAITQLEVTGYSNVSIVPGDFAGLTGLESLEIVDSPSLTTVPANAFSEVTGLTRLELYGNAISSVHEDAFDGLTNLEGLFLFNNEIATLPEDIFDGLIQLDAIHLNYNRLTTLHEDIFDGLTNLREIRLNDNEIATLHEDIFDGLTSLYNLYLNNNRLTTLHEDIFDPLIDLAFLVLSGNSLATLPEDIFDDRTIMSQLHLNNNEITTLHEDIFDGLTGLQLLWLDNNEITTLHEDIFDGLTGLDWLKLNGNRLTALDEDLFDPLGDSLENLEFSDNLLTTLPDDIFDGLTGLSWLEFNGNSITALDADLFDPLDNSLGELHFRDNLLTALPANLFDGLTGLDVLDSSCNSLTALDLDLFDPFSSSLEELDIRRNNFTVAPTDAAIRAKLTNLSELRTGDVKSCRGDAAVSFESDTYTAAEGGSVTVTVTLSATPKSAVTLPITATPQDGASIADYTIMPTSVTFATTDTSKTFTFTANDDSDNDDGESVLLSFGTLPVRVNAGTPITSTVSITDDDDPFVTVQFGANAYTVEESDDASTTDVTENEVEVTVTLSADPERMLTIPITATGQSGATSNDYSIPASVTFNAGETSKSLTFTATHDTVDDDDESVKLEFGTMPDARVSPGTRDEATVNITDDDAPFVQVMFSQNSYTAPEGGNVSVSITLSADPERQVVIPLVKTDMGTATSGDYSGVPNEVTFSSGQTSMILHLQSDAGHGGRRR